MPGIAQNIEEVRDRISSACDRAGRLFRTVELIAVSKTFTSDAIHEAWESGQNVFGESKLQEAGPKIEALPGSIHWHYIGRVQRNKIRKMLPLFEVIHALDSLRLAAHADEMASELGLFPKVFLQVNLAAESSKGGFAPELLRSEMEQVLSLGRLEILGLMSIPPAGPDAESSRRWFVALRELRDELQAEFSVTLPALSMGMSSDYEVAIEEGATHVRVGSAIFGKRSYRLEDELGDSI